MPPALPRIERLRHGAWLDRSRVAGYSSVLLVLELLTLFYFVASTHGWLGAVDRPTTTDFVSFYAAGSLANAGSAAAAYDPTQHYAAEQQGTVPGIPAVVFYYPPVYLLICAILARLPYLAAFLLFDGATLILYLFVARRILDEPGWAALAPLLACPALFWSLGFGQNALLSAALFGGATLALERKPVLAGCLFGALCYKPHFGLLIPVALAAGGYRRAFLAAAATVATCVAASIALFGWVPWQEWLALVAASPSTYASGEIAFPQYINPFGAMRLWGADRSVAYAVQGIAILAMAALVAFVWRRRLSAPVRAATLIAATPIAAPVVLFYDFMIAVIAMAWLVRAARKDGFLPWQKLAFLVLFPVPLVARNVAWASHVPLGPLASIACLALALQAALHEMNRRGACDEETLARLPA